MKSEQSHPLGDGKNRSPEAKNDRNRAEKSGVYPFNSGKNLLKNGTSPPSPEVIPVHKSRKTPRRSKTVHFCRATFASSIQSKHVTLQLLWEEYRRDNPSGYSLTQFSYHYRQNVTAKEDNRQSTILKDLYVGGEQIFLDFSGDTMSYVTRDTGEVVKEQTFVAYLPASDYGFMICVPSQSTEDFVYA